MGALSRRSRLLIAGSTRSVRLSNPLTGFGRAVWVDHDSGRAVGAPGQLDGVGYALEIDDLADDGAHVEASFADGVERAVPVFVLGTATELDGHTLAFRGHRRDVIARRATTGGEDPGAP